MTEPEKTDDYCTCKPEEFPHGRRERYMTNVPRCVRCFKLVHPADRAVYE